MNAQQALELTVSEKKELSELDKLLNRVREAATTGNFYVLYDTWNPDCEELKTLRKLGYKISFDRNNGIAKIKWYPKT